MKRPLMVLILTTLAVAPAMALSNYLCPDVPTDLSANTFLPWQVVRNDATAYGLTLALPYGTAADALFRMNGGDWLFSVETITELPPGSGVFFDPRDVVRFNGTTYSLFFNGAAAGVPAGSNVDAFFIRNGDAGTLTVSFDVPTTIGAITYDPADLLHFVGGIFMPFLDASSTTPPIPPSSNITAADLHGSGAVISFDVPTTLGGATYLPGELVGWDGVSFTSVYLDPAWPLSSRDDALSFLPTPGFIPPTMTMAKSMTTPGNVVFSWPAVGCSVGAEDYGIYEGSIGSWYSHARIDCSDNLGDFTEELTPGSGDHYYLLAPHNTNDEGSYGRDWALAERPVASATCRATQELGACP